MDNGYSNGSATPSNGHAANGHADDVGAEEKAGQLGDVKEIKGSLNKTMARAEAKAQRGLTSKMVQHLVVFVVLTFMHALALLVFKLCAVDHSYPFSPASALFCTEVTKLFLATFLHHREIASMPEDT